MDNQILAKIIYKNKLASQDAIKAYWGEITSEKNIAQVLIEKGDLNEGYYEKIINAYKKRVAKKEAKKQVEEAPRADSLKVEASAEKPTPVAIEKKEAVSEPVKVTKSKIEELNEIPSASLLEGNYVSDSNIPIEERTVDSVVSLESTSVGDFGFQSDVFSKGEESSSVNSESTKETKTVEIEEKKNVEPPVVETTKDNDSLPEMEPGKKGDGVFEYEIPKELTGNEPLSLILAFARVNGGTDIHIAALNPILLKKNGAFLVVSEKLSQVQIEKLFTEGVPETKFREFIELGDLETVVAVQGSGRFRVTLMKQQKGWDLTARVIPEVIPTFEESGLPEPVLGLTKWAQGLVLVTGPAGAGKTRTLSTLVQEIIHSRKDHIISIESPVEVVYPEGDCQVTQREVGSSTLSQANALRAALRQDPDIIVVSELRDLESMELAISAAETGHLVLGTMNTTNAMRTLSRLIDSFPPENQNIIRAMVSESLRGVVSQQLIPTKDGEGLATAFELLLTTTPIASCIRKNELHQLESMMITGRGQGMVLLDDSLKKLVDGDVIDGKEAFYRAVNPKHFEKYIKE